MKQLLFTLLVMSVFFTMPSGSSAQEKPSDNIRLNQLGFYPTAPKVAVIITEKHTDFYVTDTDLKNKFFTGKLSAAKKNDYSPRHTRIADFSAFSKPGHYVVVVPGLGYSYPFEIRSKIHEDVAKASIKNYYYQRLSSDLPETYAGKWHRKAGHPDDRVEIHPSATSHERPAGFIISAGKGWYDAGDYNKYVVNSGITMGTMLSAYEDFKAYYNTLSLHIPESNNDVPDLLDEVLWNLRWMIRMQDPDDGGVYHKLTNARFDKMVMPDAARETRYVVQKSTGAALNFTAVMAQSARIFKEYDQQFPGLSDSCLAAAQKAWSWSMANPKVEYNQSSLNRDFDPDISTGAYGDRDFTDEFIWAASELAVTTKDQQYLRSVNLQPSPLLLPSWSQVRLLGFYTLVRFEKEIPFLQPHLAAIKKQLIEFSDELIRGADEHTYNTVMGKSAKHFIWGSSAVAANQGIALIQAYKISKDKKYLDHALANLDYLLGRNGTGFSFVTGYGDKTPMHPHHRPSEADGVSDPVPGMLAGGPNPSMQDKCSTYTSSVPDEAYTDDVCSYASNEIAINWNAPLVYLAGALEALQEEAGYSGVK